MGTGFSILLLSCGWPVLVSCNIIYIYIICRNPHFLSWRSEEQSRPPQKSSEDVLATPAKPGSGSNLLAPNCQKTCLDKDPQATEQSWCSPQNIWLFDVAFICFRDFQSGFQAGSKLDIFHTQKKCPIHAKIDP